MSDILDAMRHYPSVLQACGVLGSVMYVGGFALVQTGRICGNGPIYSVNQLTAATLVLISLVGAFNLGAFLIQVGFLGFGGFGLIRRLRMRQRGQYPLQTGAIRSWSNGPKESVSQGDLPAICDWERHPREPVRDRQVQPAPVGAVPTP